MNISPSHSATNYSANQVNLPIGKNQLANKGMQVLSNDQYQIPTDNLNKTQNRSAINPVAFNTKESSSDKPRTYEASARTRSTRNINPNLLDKVFKLKSKDEPTEVNTNRRSDLYLQTENIASSKIADFGIGLDLYV